MKRWLALLGGLVFLGCDEGAEVAGDCRQATEACAAGFVCVSSSGGRWLCEPQRSPADIGRADEGLVDAAVEVLDATIADAAVEPNPEAQPAGPCGPELPCRLGTCREDLPDGFCRVECNDNEICGVNAVCSEAGVCRARCAERPCRSGWACDTTAEEPFCVTHCAEIGCADDQVCDPESGLCVAPPCVDEVCNGKDDDCDGAEDEGTLNACGRCGPVPSEACNGDDDDCDGTIDEGVLNACGTCGREPAEQCDGQDNDCDGAVDERVLNACGGCGNLPAETCDGLDSDCDGRIDEAARCPAGQACADGACRRPPSGPGGPCQLPEDCEVGECLPDLPGGLCLAGCARDADCGPGAHCLALQDGNYCFEDCAGGCREGWVCYADDDICYPACEFSGCAEGYVCGREGFCEVPLVSITLTQVFISPRPQNDTAWDGPPEQIQDEVLDQVIQLINAEFPATVLFNELLRAFGNALLDIFDAPDPFGRADLLGPWPDDLSVQLPAIQDTHAPDWGVTWQGIPLVPGEDIRLIVDLTDEDIAFDDDIGSAELNADDLRVALEVGGEAAIVTEWQGSGNILAIAVRVRAE